MSGASDKCGAATMTITSVNVHFHGMNTAPRCHSDEVIHTLINSGQTFKYNVKFPKDEPPGLYWYHPHVHGLSEAAVQGGASGAIIIDGIENLQPAVEGLPERVLIIRDQTIPNGPPPGGSVPSWDVTLNYVPIAYPGFIPAVIKMKTGETEFWRVANASADTMLDLELVYDGTAQPLRVVALDGVPIGSQDGRRQGKSVTRKHILLPPAARAEFIVKGPSAAVEKATFRTLYVDTGAIGGSDPTRTLARIVPGSSSTQLPVMPAMSTAPAVQRFEDLSAAQVTAARTLYFSENLYTNKPDQFFITVVGQKPKLFSPDNPPAIVTNRGAVEDWTINNPTFETHVFHIHQLHFQLLSETINGASVPIPLGRRQFLDLDRNSTWRERHGANGFSRKRRRRFRLSLPHSRTRRSRHDGDHPCTAAVVT